MVCMFVKMRAPLAQHFYNPLRWKTNLCMVTDLKYNFHMIVSRDDTPSSIDFLNSALADVAAFSSPCLAACNTLAMCLFLAMKNLTLEMVA